jgi:hypothetical protein
MLCCILGWQVMFLAKKKKMLHFILLWMFLDFVFLSEDPWWRLHLFVFPFWKETKCCLHIRCFRVSSSNKLKYGKQTYKFHFWKEDIIWKDDKMILSCFSMGWKCLDGVGFLYVVIYR